MDFLCMSFCSNVNSRVGELGRVCTHTQTNGNPMSLFGVLESKNIGEQKMGRISRSKDISDIKFLFTPASFSHSAKLPNAFANCVAEIMRNTKRNDWNGNHGQMQQFEWPNQIRHRGEGRAIEYEQSNEIHSDTQQYALGTVVWAERVTGCQKFNIEKSKIVMANYV